MNSRSKTRVLYAALVIALAAVLVVLAALQYRWSGEVSQAASMRLQADLQSAVNALRQDFHRELVSICVSLDLPPDVPLPERWTQFAHQVEAWKRTAAHPDLIENVYLWHGGNSPAISKLTSAGELQPAAWPAQFDELSGWMQARSLERPPFPPRPNPPPQHSRRDRFVRMERRGPMQPWLMAAEIPALVSPVVDHSRPGAPARDWIVVELSQAVLRDHIFPELAERYFGGSSGLVYRVAVVTEPQNERRVIYASHTGFGSGELREADASVNLFGPPFGPGAPRTAQVMPGPGRPEQNAGRADLHREGLHVMLARFDLLRYGGQPHDWRLVVQHRSGSLDSVVAGMRRRNLAISFGVLLVLATATAVLVVTSHRAQRLAKLQMDFVAGVSHELRTPLAVISSAAENIADGVVDNPQQMARYGEVIKGQTRQLIRLVEQVLLFAATRESGNHYHLRTLVVEEIVENALAATADLVQAAGFHIDKQMEAPLPRVRGDLGALSQALQNLITNAVKYGGERHWVGIRARLAQAGEGREVQISVEDRGAGIAAAELERIFQPFYRSASVAAAQIHGTGLGLPLARRIAEAMGGRLTVASEPGKGSCFVLHLPATEPALESPHAEPAAAANANVT